MPDSTKGKERRIHNLSEEMLNRFLTGEITLSQAYSESGFKKADRNAGAAALRYAWRKSSIDVRIEFLKWIAHGEKRISSTRKNAETRKLFRRRNYGEDVYRHANNLGIPHEWIENAEFREVKRRVKRQWPKMARKYHPDTGENPSALRLHKAKRSYEWFMALTELPDRIMRSHLVGDPLSTEAAAKGTEWSMDSPDLGYGWQTVPACEML